jgi:hypothetical protein
VRFDRLEPVDELEVAAVVGEIGPEFGDYHVVDERRDEFVETHESRTIDTLAARPASVGLAGRVEDVSERVYDVEAGELDTVVGLLLGRGEVTVVDDEFEPVEEDSSVAVRETAVWKE